MDRHRLSAVVVLVIWLCTTRVAALGTLVPLLVVGPIIAHAALPKATIIVPDNYPTIQAAIDAAAPGDTILVRPGTYAESISVTKSLALQGMDRSDTIIDGGGNDAVVHITANGVTVSGITVQHGSTGILVERASGNTIADVLARDNAIRGIWLAGAANNMVRDSRTTGADNGVDTGDWGSPNNTIINVEADHNRDRGFVGYAGSHGTQILNSRSHHNSAGITIGWSTGWRIENTSVYSNTVAGINIDTADHGSILNSTIFGNETGINFWGWGPTNNRIADNIIRNNQTGIQFSCAAAYNMVEANDIYDNSSTGIFIQKNSTCPNHDNTLFHNYLRNPINANVLQNDYANTWDDAYPNGGNYWSDYVGSDLYSGAIQDQPGSDGIGDQPYILTGVLNLDRYPLYGLWASGNSPTRLGYPAYFTATMVAGSNIVYRWDFGDGTTGSGPAVNHHYAAVGDYTVVVTASNSLRSSTANTNATVVAAIAGLTAANSGPTLLGSPTQLTATTTSGSHIIFTWDFDDGQTGSGPAVTHTYEAAGIYTATVTASNLLGSEVARTRVQVVKRIFLPVILRLN